MELQSASKLDVPIAATARRKKPAAAAKAEWAAYRGIITRLYRDERLALKELMETMERDYNFYANERMFKYRIGQWGLDRKHKETEVLEMLRLKRERDSVGKKSRFIVRNQAVDWLEVERYLRRNPKLQAKIINGNALEIGSHSTGIICRTPSPDPVIAQSVAFSLPPPSQEPEEIARLLLRYCQGSIDSANWVVTPTGNVSPRNHPHADGMAAAWHNSLESSIHGLSSAKSSVGWAGLNAAFDGLREIVRLDSSVFLVRILSTFLLLNRLGLVEITSKLCCYTADMIDIVSGGIRNRHPLALMFRRLRRLPVNEFGLAVDIAFRRVLDFFFANVETYHGIIVGFARRHLRLLEWIPDSDVATRQSFGKLASAMARSIEIPPHFPGAQYLAELYARHGYLSSLERFDAAGVALDQVGEFLETLDTERDEDARSQMIFWVRTRIWHELQVSQPGEAYKASVELLSMSGTEHLDALGGVWMFLGACDVDRVWHRKLALHIHETMSAEAAHRFWSAVRGAGPPPGSETTSPSSFGDASVQSHEGKPLSS